MKRILRKVHKGAVIGGFILTGLLVTACTKTPKAEPQKTEAQKEEKTAEAENHSRLADEASDFFKGLMKEAVGDEPAEIRIGSRNAADELPEADSLDELLHGTDPMLQVGIISGSEKGYSEEEIRKIIQLAKQQAVEADLYFNYNDAYIYQIRNDGVTIDVTTGKDGGAMHELIEYELAPSEKASIDGGSEAVLLEESSEMYAPEEIAALLSTEEIAYALDFEWFIDYVLNGGHEAGRAITDPDYSGRTYDAAALNGGWKAFMLTEDGVFGSDVERYFNAVIDTDGNDFHLTINWKYMFDPEVGSSVDETGTDVLDGSFYSETGSASVRSDFATVELEEFYLAHDGRAEYAIGTFHWASGETDRIALMRRAESEVRDSE